MKKGKGVMRFQFKVLPDWPALSWVAECSNHESVIIVYCGSKVETGNDQWFCEAVWVGEYAAGDFDQTDIVAGSGARIRDDKVMFVSPGSTVDRLQFLQHDDCIRISNSLCALLVMAEGSVDSTYYYHQRDMGSIILGLHQYKKTISTTAGPVRLVYLHNIEWDGLELRIVEKPGGVRDFSTFAKYYDFLDLSMKKLAKNSADNGRKHSLKLLCPLSNGYDSPTVAVLAKRAGCQEA
ncbi:MAG: hypothetical protein ABF290_12985, partial [Thiogranum sp.]